MITMRFSYLFVLIGLLALAFGGCASVSNSLANYDPNVDDGPFMVATPDQLVEVERTGSGLSKIDEIEIDLLDCGVSATDSGSYGCKIVASKTVRGPVARDIVMAWRVLPRSIGLSALCHEPLYGLRFRYHGRLLLETSICWGCSNYDWIGADGRQCEWGFDSASQCAQELLKLLKQQVPPRKS